ncbi:ethionine resistance protein [Saitoella coloradoensis]
MGPSMSGKKPSSIFHPDASRRSSRSSSGRYVKASTYDDEDAVSDGGIATPVAAPARRRRSGGEAAEEAGSGKHLSSSYRRPSFVYGGSRPKLLSADPVPVTALNEEEREDLEEEERHMINESKALLKAHKSPRIGGGAPANYGAILERDEDGDDGAAVFGSDDEEEGRMPWEATETTWRHELGVLVKYAVPMVITSTLQYSEAMASVFSTGHLGKTELAASSLGSMTAVITGISLFQGVATALDTLAAQAYGAGNTKLLGLHLQRCVLLLMLICFGPVAAMWLNAERLLLALGQEPALAHLAGRYLKILLIGAPGYACFEAMKRYLQAMGLFKAGTYILFIAAPLNIVLNYVLVWHPKVGLGFIGAPIAVSFTWWLMAFLGALYIKFIDGKQGWDGFKREAFSGWGPMIQLAVPGVFMVCSEWWAFEILALAASFLGTAYLAAQSVLSTTTSLTFQIPFAVSVAASTRVGNLLGAGLPKPAKTAARVAIFIAVAVGAFNSFWLVMVRHRWGYLFSGDEEVVTIVANVLPLGAFYQIFDSVTAISGGVLRGQGRQKIGGYANVFAYYVIALPLGIPLAFQAGWGLYGLWAGITIALVVIATLLTCAVFWGDWDQMADKAKEMSQEEA